MTATGGACCRASHHAITRPESREGRARRGNRWGMASRINTWSECSIGNCPAARRSAPSHRPTAVGFQKRNASSGSLSRAAHAGLARARLSFRAAWRVGLGTRKRRIRTTSRGRVPPRREMWYLAGSDVAGSSDPSCSRRFGHGSARGLDAGSSGDERGTSRARRGAGPRPLISSARVIGGRALAPAGVRGSHPLRTPGHDKGRHREGAADAAAGGFRATFARCLTPNGHDTEAHREMVASPRVRSSRLHRIGQHDDRGGGARPRWPT